MKLEKHVPTRAILLRKTEYRNTSYVFRFLSPKLGLISVMGKGIRNETHPDFALFDLGSELDLLLSQSQSELFFLKQSQFIKAHLHQVDYEKSRFFYAAIEIYLQLILEEMEAAAMYNLLLSYWNYLKQISCNEIAIFWRFLLRIFHFYGVELNLETCVICEQPLKQIVAMSPALAGFSDCKPSRHSEEMISLSTKAAKVLKQLPQIGNVIEEVSMDLSTQKEITKLFLLHLNEHFHKRFSLKSLNSFL